MSTYRVIEEFDQVRCAPYWVVENEAGSVVSIFDSEDEAYSFLRICEEYPDD